jgi:hypothetical protein
MSPMNSASMRSREAQPAFPPNVVVEIKRIACERPMDAGVPLARWSLSDFRQEVLARGLVATISGTTLWLDADAMFGDAAGECIHSVDTAWTAACRRAAIVGLNFHDLRREAGSRLLESGMPEHYVQRFLDHANLSTTSRYLKTTRGDTRGAQARRGAPKPLHSRCTRDPSCATVDGESH